MNSSIARVYVNDVEVGSLPVDTYNNIVKTVRNTPSLYFLWFKSFLLLIFRKVFGYFQAVPFVLISAFFLLLIVSPEIITSLITDFKIADPGKITEDLREIVKAVFSLGVIAMPLSALFFPENWRFYNPFEHEVSLRIRKLLEVPTEGKLVVEISKRKNNVEE